MKILISDQDRDVVVQALYKACLQLGINPDYRRHLADAALDALTRSPDVERIFAVEGQWSRPPSLKLPPEAFSGTPDSRTRQE